MDGKSFFINISAVQEFQLGKDLGVTIYLLLSITPHIKSIMSKAMQCIFKSLFLEVDIMISAFQK